MLYVTIIAFIIVLVIVRDQLGIEWFALLGVTAPLWIGVAIILLAGCSPLQVTGNERGGMVAGDTTPDLGDGEVFAAATAHCAKYGRKPLVSSIRRGAGYRSALFDCA